MTVHDADSDNNTLTQMYSSFMMVKMMTTPWNRCTAKFSADSDDYTLTQMYDSVCNGESDDNTSTQMNSNVHGSENYETP